MDFGIFLLNDDDGSQMDSIKMECQGRPECIAQRILQEWVLGRGKPLTWHTLVETLRDCELNVLADHNYTGRQTFVNVALLLTHVTIIQATYIIFYFFYFVLL